MKPASSFIHYKAFSKAATGSDSTPVEQGPTQPRSGRGLSGRGPPSPSLAGDRALVQAGPVAPRFSPLTRPPEPANGSEQESPQPATHTTGSDLQPGLFSARKRAKKRGEGELVPPLPRAQLPRDPQDSEGECAGRRAAAAPEGHASLHESGRGTQDKTAEGEQQRHNHRPAEERDAPRATSAPPPLAQFKPGLARRAVAAAPAFLGGPRGCTARARGA